MKSVKPLYIKRALQAEVMNIEPSRDVWSKIAPVLPPSKNLHHRKMRISLAALMIMVFVLSSSSLVLADTSYGKQVVDWVFQKFGIHLITRTPQLTEELKKSGLEAFIQAIPLKDNLDKIPSGMKMPSYLPESVAKSDVKICELSNGAGIRWAVTDQQFAEVWYHSEAFGEGSKTLTNGEPRDIQEVKIGNLPGMAFRDDYCWQLSWAMEGHQYTVLTNISLEEAVKIANSIK